MKNRSISQNGPRNVSHRRVQPEVKVFLKALHSYPDRFARDPCVSFEQHLYAMAAANDMAADARRK